MRDLQYAIDAEHSARTSYGRYAYRINSCFAPNDLSCIEVKGRHKAYPLLPADVFQQ